MDSVDITSQLIDGSYQIHSLLGSGGKGAVYKATQMSMGRTVALKVMLPEAGSNPTDLQRFQRELIATGMLNHPNIVQTIAAGTHEGQLYLVMEYIEGHSLKEVLQAEGKLPVERALQITRDVCAALTHAHANGVVHRDVKPANIMLTNRDGKETAVLADFGIARLLGEAGKQVHTITESAAVVGTPVYMSPEQGSRNEVCPQSDVYSLACCLYEMISGRPPFEGTTAFDTMFKHMYETPARLDAIDKSVPAAVAQAVATALLKVPSARQQSALEFSESLTQTKPTTIGAGGRLKLTGSQMALVCIAIVLAVGSMTLLVLQKQPPKKEPHSVVGVDDAMQDTLGRAYTCFINRDFVASETPARRPQCGRCGTARA